MANKNEVEILGDSRILYSIISVLDFPGKHSFSDKYVSVGLRDSEGTIIPKRDILSLGLEVPYKRPLFNDGNDYSLNIQMIPVDIQDPKKVERSKRPLYYLSELESSFSSPLGTFVEPGEEDIWKDKEEVSATFRLVQDCSSFRFCANLSWEDGGSVRKYLESLVEQTDLGGPVFLARAVGVKNQVEVLGE